MPGPGYSISFNPDPGPGPNTGNPLATVGTITTGNWEGLQGLITPYTIVVTAKSSTGNSEVRLRRELQTVAVPVFQFGIFGQNDLGFHAGPDFNFGGRVHTNGSLFLAQGSGNDLTLSDKITAYTQVVRDKIINGAQITTTNHTGNVLVRNSGSTYRNLLATETSGTITEPCVASATTNSNCWSGWKNLSEVTYATNIRTRATGAKLLNLPLAQQGAAPIDLVRRPVVLSNENTANPVVYAQRYYSQASLRILLSDRAADITGLPTVSAGAPVDLSTFANLANGFVPAAGRPPQGRTQGEVGENALFGLAARFTRINPAYGGGTTLPIQWALAAGGPWNNGVPPWMRWSEIRMGAGSHGGGGVVVVCEGMTGTQLQDCAIPAGGYPNNTQIQVRRPDNTPLNITMTAAVASGAGVDVPITGLPNNSLANLFFATKTFFVGEDPVTCATFQDNATDLLNCGWGGVGAVAASEPVYMGATIGDHQPYLHGFIKIERQNAAGAWADVTMELLNLGFSGRNQDGRPLCGPDAQRGDPLAASARQRTAGWRCGVAATNYSASLDEHDFWPNNIFDAREGNTRLLPVNAGMNIGGIFSYVALDVNNYRRWVTGAIGATGNTSLNNNGFIVYFSDRRGNHNPLAGIADAETGEYGFDDSLNPGAAVWAKDNALNPGEDVNQNNLRELYGETPWNGAGYIGGGAVVPFNALGAVGAVPNSAPWASIPLNRSGRDASPVRCSSVAPSRLSTAAWSAP